MPGAAPSPGFEKEVPMRATFSDFEEVSSLQELVTVLSRVEDFVDSVKGSAALLRVVIQIEVEIPEISKRDEEEEKAS